MSSDKNYLKLVLDKLDSLYDINYKSMMGEYIIYYKNKIIAYVCDNHLFIKPTNKAKYLIKNYVLKPPYQNAKDMIFIENINDYSNDFFNELFISMYDELPLVNNKKGKIKL